ncbi:MAG: hypothetical protein U9R15_07490, partial [Chloroflexota bacterium]|nr:hypothetical protein [Chloroflexota bacterium]
QVTTNDGSTFNINSGTAINGEGKVIKVPQITAASGSIGEDPKYRPSLPDRTSLTTGVTSIGTYYVNLEYTALYADIRYDDNGNSFETRVYDSYAISVADTQTSTGIVLAQITCNADGSIQEDSTETGYYSTSTGKYYAIFDERTAFSIEDSRIGDLETLTVEHEVDLNEELEKSVGFLYPQRGHAFSSQILRDVQIDRMLCYCHGTGGTIDVHLFSGSSADIGTMNLIGMISTSPDEWATLDLDVSYTKGHTLRFEVYSVSSSITECTVSLVYTRR